MKLPAAVPGSQINVGGTIGPQSSSINKLKNKGTPTTSMAALEAEYMGGNPANAVNSGVCMPNQVEKSSDTNWTYNGPSVAWRPTRFSEFAEAYNTLPQIYAGTSQTGNSTLGNVYAYGTNTEAYINAATPHSFWAERLAGTASHPLFGQWVVANQNGPQGINTQYTWSNVTVSFGATVRVYIRDYKNCGTNKEIYRDTRYPY